MPWGWLSGEDQLFQQTCSSCWIFETSPELIHDEKSRVNLRYPFENACDQQDMRKKILTYHVGGKLVAPWLTTGWQPGSSTDSLQEADKVKHTHRVVEPLPISHDGMAHGGQGEI